MGRVLAPVVLPVDFVDAFKHTVLHHRNRAAGLHFFGELEDEGDTALEIFTIPVY